MRLHNALRAFVQAWQGKPVDGGVVVVRVEADTKRASSDLLVLEAQLNQVIAKAEYLGEITEHLH